MRKLMLYGARDLRLEEVPLPTTLSPTQVRLKTAITGVSTGTERTLYTYENPHWSEMIRGPLPYDMGYNNIGVITEVGAAVTRFQVGDRVYSIAPHTTEDIFEQEGMIAKVPDGVDAEDAVFTHLMSLGLHALRRGDFTPGARVAVIGMGVIGLCTVAVAKAVGAQVLAVGRGAARLAMAKQLGADQVLADAASCTYYANDIFWQPGVLPAAIVLPRTRAQAVAAVEVAAAHAAAIVPRGGGMSYTKGYLPESAGAALKNAVPFVLYASAACLVARRSVRPSAVVGCASGCARIHAMK